MIGVVCPSCGPGVEWVLENPNLVLTSAPLKVWCVCKRCGHRDALAYYENPEVERLRKENSELKVRDSNVTFHSRNVMAVNEALRKKIESLATAGDALAAQLRQIQLRQDFDGPVLSGRSQRLGESEGQMGDGLYDGERMSRRHADSCSCATCEQDRVDDKFHALIGALNTYRDNARVHEVQATLIALQVRLREAVK